MGRPSPCQGGAGRDDALNVAYDGFVSRHINRRFSRPIARLLAHTPVTPNQVSLLSLVIAVGSLALFFNDHPLWAGGAVQASSIVDGVDGDLARHKNIATRFGGFFDAILDRYSDVAILGGLTYWSVTFEERLSPEPTAIIGVLAIVGALMISYSRARAEASLGFTFQGLAGNLASRDSRLLIVMIGAILGQGLACLAVIAVLSNSMVLWRLAVARSRS